MKRLLFFGVLFSVTFWGSTSPHSDDQNRIEIFDKGALLSTDFKSLEALKKVVHFEYKKGGKPSVRLTHFGRNRKVTSVLKTGISEKDFSKAKDGNFWKKVKLAFKTPYSAFNKNDLFRVYLLARRNLPNRDDPAFYDIALHILSNISDHDCALTSSEELSEKGYLNTFNHITAQAFTTSIFSEKLSDFIADIHERKNMPELITGTFSKKQLNDLETGPVDNYVDMINNEWGQELGKELGKKHKIDKNTYWTPELLKDYLNDIQSYYSWVFQIGFKPFKASDEMIIVFSTKLNIIAGHQLKSK